MDKKNDQQTYSFASSFTTGIKCRCPRCTEGKLFTGLLKPASGCTHCGLDFSFEDSGDGPTVIVMLIVGFVIVGPALYIEFVYQPPIWLHFLLWPFFLIVFGLWVLRVTKSLLIVFQYRLNAHEGELITEKTRNDRNVEK